MRTVVVKSLGTVAQDVTVGAHHWTSDTSVESGGGDTGPSPHELLAAALGSCTAMTLVLYSKRKQWPLQGIDVQVEIERISDTEVFHRKIKLAGPLDATQTQRLLEIANQCPVHRTLSGKISIQTEIEKSEA